MSYVSKRIVKGKKYYYLEESFFFENKLVKESVYFGSSYPSNNELFLGYEVLKRTCLERNHLVLVPPLTKFVSSRSAKLIQNAIESKQLIKSTNPKSTNPKSTNSKSTNSKSTNPNLLNKLNSPQNKKKLINSFQEFGEITGIKFDSKKINKMFDYYSKSIKNKELFSEKKIIIFHELLFGEKKVFLEEELIRLQLLFSWLKEKKGLIHSIEFSATFFGKFFSLNLFDEKKSIVLGLIIANYLLEENNFFSNEEYNEPSLIESKIKEINQNHNNTKFILFQKKQFPYFKRALLQSTKEDFKPLTVLFIKKIVRENKKLIEQKQFLFCNQI